MTASNSPAQRLDLKENNSTPKGDCPNAKVPHIFGQNTADKRAIIFRPRCKMWCCPVCGPANAWVWSFRASEGAHELHDRGHSLAFATITPHEKLSAEGAYWVLPKAWGKLQARIRREHGRYEYFLVPERHASGKPHVHMITTADLAGRWFKDNARECGFGYMSDVQDVWSEGGVVGYVMKYMTKMLEDREIPRGLRRVRTSRGWPKSAKRDPPPDWKFAVVPKSLSLMEFANRLEDRGLTVHFLGSRSAWSVVSPSD